MATYAFSRENDVITVNSYVDEYRRQYSIENDTYNGKLLIYENTGGLHVEITVASDTVTINGTPFSGTSTELREQLMADIFFYTSVGQSPAAYLVYSAIISQSGSDAPVATVLENTLGGTPVWTRWSAGEYYMTLTDGLTNDKTWVMLAPPHSTPTVVHRALHQQDNSAIAFYTTQSGNPIDDCFFLTSVEVRVYP